MLRANREPNAEAEQNKGSDSGHREDGGLETGQLSATFQRILNPFASLARVMDVREQQARLTEAFDRIEETILPCIAMMLDTLLDASANLAEVDPKALAAELQTLAAELEELTRTVERSSPNQVDPGRYRTAAA